jgi:hypothetical protein
MRQRMRQQASLSNPEWDVGRVLPADREPLVVVEPGDRSFHFAQVARLAVRLVMQSALRSATRAHY